MTKSQIRRSTSKRVEKKMKDKMQMKILNTRKKNISYFKKMVS